MHLELEDDKRYCNIMAQQMLTEVVVDGLDISNTRFRKWKDVETFGDTIRDAIIEVTNSIFDDLPDLAPGNTITIKRGFTTATDQNVFDGFIDRIDKQGPYVTIYAHDQMIQLVKATVTYSYDGINFPSTESKGSDIMKDLIETWGGMTAEVVDTGTLITIKKLICNGTDVFSRLQVLADIYDYQIYYDADDSKVHCEPKGYTTNAQTLYVGGANKNVSNLPKWKQDNTQCVNKLEVRGATQEVQDDEYFDGDGTADQVFTLTKKPVSTYVFEDSTLKIGGVVGSTSGTFDYTVDKDNKQILSTSAWAPAVGSNNVKITYINAIPHPVQVEDSISQGKYGIYSAVKWFSDIETVDDAEQRGNGWLTKYSEPFFEVTLKPENLVDYEAGQKVSVVDILNNENREMVINRITKSYPYNGDDLQLGDKEWRLAEWGKFTLERIRRLEEEIDKDTDLLIQVKSFTHTVSHLRRYLEAQTRQIEGGNDILIYNQVTFGFWNTYKWGTDADAFTDAETIRLVWPAQKYVEKFIDEDFKGTGTATWDTAQKALIFD